MSFPSQTSLRARLRASQFDAASLRSGALVEQIAFIVRSRIMSSGFTVVFYEDWKQMVPMSYSVFTGESAWNIVSQRRRRWNSDCQRKMVRRQRNHLNYMYMEPKTGIENNVEYLKSIGLHETIVALPIENNAHGLRISWR